jgi:hypothetical protein
MSNSKKIKYITDNRLLRSGEGLPDFLDINVLSELLIKDPLLLNRPDSKTGWTLLIRAVMNNNFQIAEFLLERNANPDIQNIYGETALHMAVENGNHKIINLLLEKSANPDLQQQDGETPMHLAALKGDYKVIKLLLLFRANPFILTNANGYSALDYATERGHSKCIQVLKPLFEKPAGGNNVFNNDYMQNNGLQTSKNSYSPMDRYKNKIDMNIFPFYNINNTARHNSTMLRKQEINSSFSIKEDGKAGKAHERHRSFQIPAFINKDLLDDNDSSGHNSFMNQMSTLENRLHKIRKEVLQVGNLSQISSDKMKIDEPGAHEIQTPSSNYMSSNVENYRFSFMNNLDNVNYASKPEIKGTKFSTKQLMTFSEKSSPEHKETNQDVRNFTLNNYEGESNMRLIPMKPEDLMESYYENPELSRITYLTNQIQPEDNIFNMPLQIRNQNYSYYLSKINDSYWNDMETHYSNQRAYQAAEKFIDNSRVLAIFISSKNDIIDSDKEIFTIQLNPIEYENTFENNNITNNNNNPNGINSNNQNNFNYISKNSTGEIKNIKYFSKASKSAKDDFKQISLDTQTISEEINIVDIDFNEDINIDNTKTESPESNEEYNQDIYEFLRSIDMELYYRLFIKNGFDDFNLMVEQMKGDLAITDTNLKDIGIGLPGHRAKILLKLQDEAELLHYSIPGQVFYTSKYNMNNSENLKKDIYAKKIYEWLSSLKLEKYTQNFLKNGYHTLDLLYCQMFSR